MRITDTFNLGHLKCTLFLHESLYTLQIEDEYGAITYKLKSMEQDKLAMIKEFLPIKKIQDEIISSFRSMRMGRDSLLGLLTDEAELEDEII